MFTEMISDLVILPINHSRRVDAIKSYHRDMHKHCGFFAIHALDINKYYIVHNIYSVDECNEYYEKEQIDTIMEYAKKEWK
jgi:hypothetical protein